MIPNVNQFMTQLRMMPDQALQRMAMMYKNDPYIFPMVISEDMARKKLRQAAQAELYQPKPEVADQAIMGMGQQAIMAAGGGLTGLKSPNMERMADGGIAGYDDGGDVVMSPGMLDFAQKSEPVVRMDEGGVARYQRGGDVKSRFVDQYRDVAEKVSAELGVDPNIILSQWGLESGWGTKTVGDYNLGNIKDFTGKGKKAFDRLEGSESAYKSYKSPEDFARDYTSLIKRNFPNAIGAGRDVGAFTEGLSKGKTGAYATDPEYGKKLATILTNLIPMGSVQAAATRQDGLPAPATGRAKIPGQTMQAPPVIPEGFFSRLGSNLGLSEEAKRNIGNILMAPTPMGVVTAPAKGAGKLTGIERLQRFFGSPSAARRLTPEEIQAMQTATAASKNAKAVEEAAEAARMAGAMPGEAKAVSQSVEAAQLAKQAAKTPSAAEQIQLLQQAERARDAARATQVVSPAVRRAQEAKQATALSTMLNNRPAALPKRPEEAAPIETLLEQRGVTKDDKKEAVDTAKAAIPKKERKGLTDDDLVEIGLRMMADPGRSGEGFAGFLGSAGRAGLGALAARREREKAEREEFKDLSETELRQALAKKYGAEAAYLTEGTKGAKAALDAANVAFKSWADNLSAMEKINMTEEQRRAAREYFIREAFIGLGLTVPAGLSSQQAAMPAMPKGIIVRQTG